MPPVMKSTHNDDTQQKLIILALGMAIGALAVALVPFPQFELMANTFYSIIGK